MINFLIPTTRQSIGDHEPEKSEENVAQLLRKQHEAIYNMVKYFDQSEMAQDREAKQNQLEGTTF